MEKPVLLLWTLTKINTASQKIKFTDLRETFARFGQEGISEKYIYRAMFAIYFGDQCRGLQQQAESWMET